MIIQQNSSQVKDADMRERETSGDLISGQADGNDRLQQVIDQVWIGIKQHVNRRPLLPHLLVWLSIGVMLGITLAPDFRWVSLLAFSIAGIIASLFLCVITYPFSDHHRLTLCGALAGMIILPIAGLAGFETAPITPSFSLIIGALLGGTCLVWMGPARYIMQRLPGTFQPASSKSSASKAMLEV